MSKNITELASDLVRIEPGKVLTIVEVTDEVLERVQKLYEAGEVFVLPRVKESAQALGAKDADASYTIVPSSNGSHVRLNKLMEKIASDPVLAEELHRGLFPPQTYAEKFAQVPPAVVR